MAAKITNAPDHAPAPWRKQTAGLYWPTKGAHPWLYRVVPPAIIEDADLDGREQGAQPLYAALAELATKSGTGAVKRRKASRPLYRQIHILSICLPDAWRPTGPLASQHREWFSDRIVDRRVVMLGIKLVPSLTESDRRKSLFANLAAKAVQLRDQILDPDGMTIADYARDHAEISSVLARAGLSTPTRAQHQLATTWVDGAAARLDAITIRHDDHIHVLRDGGGSALYRLSDDALLDDCDRWPDDVITEHQVSLAAAVHIPSGDSGGLDDPMATWAARLHRSGALAVSVRALLEPGQVTREELRRLARKLDGDEATRAEANKASRSETIDAYAEVRRLEDHYAAGEPCLTDVAVTVAIDGRVDDYLELSELAGVDLKPLLHRQGAALADMQPCSGTRANPHLLDATVGWLAGGGAQSVSQVGDPSGCLVGFSELDGQPCLFDPAAASATDSAPLVTITGATGSGKTLLAQWLAHQTVESGRPVIYVDPKQDSDLSGVVLAAGGQVYTLDDLLSADGVLDPYRYADQRYAAEAATAYLLAANPWGTPQARAEIEASLAAGLDAGARAGAGCTMAALEVAVREEILTEDQVRPIRLVAESDPLFRLSVGSDPQGEPLRTSASMTLIAAGGRHIPLPDPSTPAEHHNLRERVGAATLRQIVVASAYALKGRKGVVLFDEAWVFSSVADEIARLGRLARSLDFTPILMSQRVGDTAALTPYISRGLILPLGDRDDAELACRGLGLEPTEQRLHRLTRPKGDWEGMHSIVTRERGETVVVERGTVAYYSDLQRRCVPVEIVVPPWFIALASTNPEDVRRRAVSGSLAGRDYTHRSG